ncbi:MAG TPA: peptidylprolyl isomerase [Bryobacteraceae bacterium]|jgi:peptidyl-prolyl cis-trans isomerase A (cyclophilin A)|nr:peptidylprolyl isomerase [Bryobacteraceae bacterium]
MRFIRSITTGLMAAVICLAQAPAPTDLPAEPGLYAVFDTSMGRIVARLYDDKAPATVKNFVALATGTKATLDKKGTLTKRRYYDGLTFHRVIKRFMIQTGDVNATGSSPCGIPNLRDEIDPSLNFKEPGRLAMANTGRPNTGACQIFITVGTPEYLTGMYTIFGQVVSGQDVADRISQVPTAQNDKPLVPVTINTVTIRRKQ